MRFKIHSRATAAIGLAALALAVQPAAARERMTGEEKLAKMLDGRVAGEARSCVTAFRSHNMTIVDKTAIVVRDGSTLWVNVPRHPEALDSDDVLLTRTYGSSLCRQDHVTTLDRSGHFVNGVVFLGDFVPYRRTKS